MSSSTELKPIPNESSRSTRSLSPSESSSSYISQRSLSTTKFRITLVLVLIMFVTITLTRFRGVLTAYTTSAGNGRGIIVNVENTAIRPLNPKEEILLGGSHFYMLPKTPFEEAIGVLIVFHPCNRSGVDFFLLPEDRIVAKNALEKGLAVLSLTSKDRESGCFTTEDTGIVNQVVDKWTNLHNLSKVPRYGMGISSGGSFLFFVYKELHIKRMVVYNTPQGFLPSDHHDETTMMMIPTAFVTMSMDKPLSRRIRENHKELSKRHIPTQLFQISPRPFKKEVICKSRLPEMKPKDCDRIFESLQGGDSHHQLLDKDGNVLQDITESYEWKELVSTLDLDAWPSSSHFPTSKTSGGHSWPYASIEQELHACYGRHGMNSQHHVKIMEFLLLTAASSSSSSNKKN